MSDEKDRIDSPIDWVLDYASARTGMEIEERDLEEIGIKLEPRTTEKQQAAGRNVRSLKQMIDNGYEALTDD